MIYLTRSYLRNRLALLLAGIIVSVVSGTATPRAATYITPGLRLSCNQLQTLKIDCEYQVPGGSTVTEIAARYKNERVTILDRNDYPWPGAYTDILLLIDTSDPDRQDAIDAKIRHAGKILASAKSHHRFTLATFDKEFMLRAGPASTQNEMLEKLLSIKAVGLTTELYRNLLQAIRLLADDSTGRKSIILMSDGLAEDKAYFHTDVVAASISADVAIYTIGYPRSVAQSVGLQVLRRLSEETGADYIETGTDFNLAAGYAEKLLAGVDSGGSISLSLSGLTAAADEPPQLDFSLQTANTTYRTTIPVKLVQETPRAPPVASERSSPPVAATPVTNASATAAAGSSPPREGLDLWLWYAVPAALIVLILLTLITIYLLFKKQSINLGNLQLPSSDKPLAYLVTQDEDARQYAITKSTWRIGRSQDNELALDDNSISRKHAEIHRNDDGKFILTDMNSLNGVYINEQQILKQELNEGDIIEVGDIFLRFTEHSPTYYQEENTIMQQTKNPAYSDG